MRNSSTYLSSLDISARLLSLVRYVSSAFVTVILYSEHQTKIFSPNSSWCVTTRHARRVVRDVTWRVVRVARVAMSVSRLSWRA